MNADAGPAFTVAASGRSLHGVAWVLLRRRGGRLVRINLAAADGNLWETLALVGRVLSSLPERPTGRLD